MSLPTSEMACSSKFLGVCFIALFCESMICFARVGVRKFGVRGVVLSLRESRSDSWQSMIFFVVFIWIASVASLPRNDGEKRVNALCDNALESSAWATLSAQRYSY